MVEEISLEFYNRVNFPDSTHSMYINWLSMIVNLDLNDFTFLSFDESEKNKNLMIIEELLSEQQRKFFVLVNQHLQNSNAVESNSFLLLELSIIENNFKALKNEKLEKDNVLSHVFFQKRLKKLFIDYYKSIISIYKKNYKLLLPQEVVIKNNTTKTKKYFDLNQDIKIDFDILNINLKALNLVPQNSKKTTLNNIFKTSNTGKLIWEGKVSDLNYFIKALHDMGIVKDKNIWSISKGIFVDKDGLKFKTIESPRGKNISKIGDKIIECLKSSIETTPKTNK